MKRSILLVLPLMMGSAALAQTEAPATEAPATTEAPAAPVPMVEDADASGTWSVTELQAVWTDLTEDGFTAIDTNADGSVDPAELQTAWENGLLKPVEG